MLFHWRTKNTFSSLLQIVTYQWTWKHLPYVLRSTELNTLGMTNTIIYRDFLRRATGDNLSIEGVEHFMLSVTFHLLVVL